MRQHLRKIAAILCLASVPHLAVASGAESTKAGSENGVLCAWNILLLATTVGDLCFPDTDKDFKALLTESIGKVDAFIITNAPATVEQVESEKKRIKDGELSIMSKMARERESDVEDLCQTNAFRDGLELYNRMKAQATEELRALITKLLAVPLKPVMGDCL